MSGAVSAGGAARREDAGGDEDARTTTLRLLAAALVVGVGIVHVQQYADGISDVPKIGVLFALNAIGAGVAAAMLAIGPRVVRLLGALAGFGVAAGAFVSLLLARSGNGLFDYQEPDFRAAVVISLIVEALAIAALGAWLLAQRRRDG